METKAFLKLSSVVNSSTKVFDSWNNPNNATLIIFYYSVLMKD